MIYFIQLELVEGGKIWVNLKQLIFFHEIRDPCDGAIEQSTRIQIGTGQFSYCYEVRETVEQVAAKIRCLRGRF